MQRESSRYHRIDDLPASIGREFRESADLAGLSTGEAFLRIVQRLGDLPGAIAEGQRRMKEVKYEDRVRLDVWVPPEVKKSLLEAAEICGVKVGAVGRLLLAGRRGHIHELLVGAGEGASEKEPVAAGAAAGKSTKGETKR